MRAHDAASRPRWSGQPGWFEIWFLVVVAPGTGRAWWLRWTTFAPPTGPPRATLWAAAFDAGAPEPVVAGKAILPVTAWDAGPADRFAIRIGEAELSGERARGEVHAGGHTIGWDLRIAPGDGPVTRGPWLLDRLPLPTHVRHASPDLRCTGWFEVDGRRHAVDDAPGVQKHLWGTRRVEELVWVCCPRFDDVPAAALEATAVRAARRLPGTLGEAPWLVPVWARTGAGEHDWSGLPWMLRNRVVRTGPTAVAVEATGLTRALRARAWCDPRTLAGWVYRDPAGTDLHVAQSDVAACELELLERGHPLASWRVVARARTAAGAALELHAPEPLPGVRYVAWDADALGDASG